MKPSNPKKSWKSFETSRVKTKSATRAETLSVVANENSVRTKGDGGGGGKKRRG